MIFLVIGGDPFKRSLKKHTNWKDAVKQFNVDY